MKSELAEKLRKDHPILQCSIEVGDGWYYILDSLFTCIEHEQRLIEDTRAWSIKNFQFEDLPQFPIIEFNQIKEKFGTLRIYYSCEGNDRIYGMVSMAENISGYTCEDCGNVGSKRNSSWYKTLCNQCFVEQELKQ